MAKSIKVTMGIILFCWFKVITGLIITFYPYNSELSFFKEIMAIIGALIILTSGVKITFSNILKDITKPK